MYVAQFSYIVMLHFQDLSYPLMTERWGRSGCYTWVWLSPFQTQKSFRPVFTHLTEDEWPLCISYLIALSCGQILLLRFITRHELHLDGLTVSHMLRRLVYSYQLCRMLLSVLSALSAGNECEWLQGFMYFGYVSMEQQTQQQKLCHVFALLEPVWLITWSLLHIILVLRSLFHPVPGKRSCTILRVKGTTIIQRGFF